MGDSAKRLASTVVAGVGLLVAGCSEVRNSVGGGTQRPAAPSSPDRTAVENESRTEQPAGRAGGTNPGVAQGPADGTPGANSDTTTRMSTPVATSTPSSSSPTPAGPTATDTSATPGSGYAGGGAGGSASGSLDAVGGSAGGTAGTGGASATAGTSGGTIGTSTGTTGSSGSKLDGTGGGSSDGSGDASGDGSGTGSGDGPALVVVGESGTAPYSARRTISLGDSELGYLCDVDLKRPFVTWYSFGAGEDRPLHCYLLPTDQLDLLLAGEAHRTLLTISDLSSFEMGPFTLAEGRYAIVVEQAAQSSTGPVEVTFEFELRREAV